MDHFTYRNGKLHAEGVDLQRVAESLGTPAFVYSAATLTDHYDRLAGAFAELEPQMCYSIKSCGNIHILRLLAERGSGMDVVSGGEIRRALAAGVDPAKLVYAGVGKTDEEIRFALETGVGRFNVESEAEFENIARIAAEMGVVGHAALRVNPDVSDERTHAKTTTGKKETKFGVDIDRARDFFERYGKSEHCRLDGIHAHIGSPIYSPEPYARAVDRVMRLVHELERDGFPIAAINFGGGFAADYESGASPQYTAYADALAPKLKPFKERGGRVLLEPGRTIAANAGVLLTRVQYVKIGGAKKFIIVDTGMHHMIRPTLYDAWQFIWPCDVPPNHVPPRRAPELDLPGLETVDVVGPICETGDYLALGPRPAPHRPRRPARRLRRRGLRHHHVVQLQRHGPTARGPRRRRRLPCHPSTRNLRRPARPRTRGRARRRRVSTSVRRDPAGFASLLVRYTHTYGLSPRRGAGQAGVGPGRAPREAPRATSRALRLRCARPGHARERHRRHGDVRPRCEDRSVRSGQTRGFSGRPVGRGGSGRPG